MRSAQVSGLTPFVLLLVPALVLSGCDTIGPSAIKSGRAAYNEAITATNNQQIFSLIVRTRYREASGLLSVASVNANFKVTGQIGAQAGIGPDANFAGNLVPLSAGAAYEESPTISYTPVQGQNYLHEVFGPLPLDLAMLVIQASQNPGWTMTMLVKSINGVRNPAFLSDVETEANPRFAEISDLLAVLHRAERLSWAAKADGSFVLVVPGDDSAYRGDTLRLLELLGLAAIPRDAHAIEIPVMLGIGRTVENEIYVETRSLTDLITIASAAVEVPEEQIESGLAARLPPLGPVGSLIKISGTPEAPNNALVAIKHHGVWYSIALTDQKSKQYFRQLEGLLSARIADAAHGQEGSPVLTLPVAR